MTKFGIAFSLGNQIISIYRREFDFEHSYKRVRDALLRRNDFVATPNTFCLSFYHINHKGEYAVQERYYCPFYPDYIKTYLKTQIL